MLGLRPLDLLEFRQLDAGAKVDLIQDGLKLRIEEAFAPFGDSKGQPVQCGARNSARQQPIADFVQEIKQLLTMMDPTRVTVGSVLNSLDCKDGIDGSYRTTAGQRRSGFGIGNFFGCKARSRRCGSTCRPLYGRDGIGPTCGFDFQALNPPLPLQPEPRALGLKKR